MTFDELHEFFQTFSETEHHLWVLNFTERDEMKYRMERMAISRLYAPKMESSIRRGPRKKAEWFEGIAKEQLQRVKERDLVAVALVNGGVGVLYTSNAGPNAKPGYLHSRLLVRDTDKGRRVTGVAKTCFFCGGSGTRDGKTCPECQGARWLHSQGETLPGKAERTAFEVVAAPTQERSQSVFDHLVEGGL